MAEDDSAPRTGVGAGGEADPDFQEVRTVTDLETLRLLADPLRLSILGAFASSLARRRPMSVKEIAEKIDEGQTKLYRHIKKLEEAGLLRVAETRVVSGIIEKRYLPAQKRLAILDSMLTQEPEADDFTSTVVALMDATRDRLRTEIRAGRVQLSKPDEGPDTSPLIGSIRMSMTMERYTALHAKLTELMESLGPSDEGPDTVPVHLQAVLFTTVEQPEAVPEPAADAAADAELFSDVAMEAELFLATEQPPEARPRATRKRAGGEDQTKHRHA